jgi:transmembrane sensor
MENRFKLNSQIYEEACEWFIECRAGDLDDASRHDFDCWLRKSPEHLGAYLELAAIWNEGPSLIPASQLDSDTLIHQAALDRDNVVALPASRIGADASRNAAELRTVLSAADDAAAAPAASVQSLTYPSRWRFRRQRFAAIAASIVFMVFSSATILWVQAVRSPTYATAIGEQRSLELEDGSVVDLNSRSKIVVRYSRQGRNVELVEGQALFRVVKDATRPFIVKVGATLVRAVGTEFDVYAKRDSTIVTVVEGRVAILTDHPIAPPIPGVPSAAVDTPHRSNVQFPSIAPGKIGNILVASGEQLTVSPQEIQKDEHPNIANATAWTQRQLVFESASLSDVADEFNRYNDKQLIVEDPRLDTFHVSGVFSSTDPASLIRFLRARPELRIVETDSQIRIEKNSL